jgi:hypothetical protein
MLLGSPWPCSHTREHETLPRCGSSHRFASRRPGRGEVISAVMASGGKNPFDRCSVASGTLYRIDLRRGLPGLVISKKANLPIRAVEFGVWRAHGMGQGDICAGLSSNWNTGGATKIDDFAERVNLVLLAFRSVATRSPTLQ